MNLGLNLLDHPALYPFGTVDIDPSYFHFGQPSPISTLLVIGTVFDVKDIQRRQHLGHLMPVFNPVAIYILIHLLMNSYLKLAQWHFLRTLRLVMLL